ncbi:MAG: hypothetical protein WBM40_20215 [Thiohalocapsa sp.]
MSANKLCGPLDGREVCQPWLVSKMVPTEARIDTEILDHAKYGCLSRIEDTCETHVICHEVRDHLKAPQAKLLKSP